MTLQRIHLRLDLILQQNLHQQPHRRRNIALLLIFDLSQGLTLLGVDGGPVCFLTRRRAVVRGPAARARSWDGRRGEAVCAEGGEVGLRGEQEQRGEGEDGGAGREGGC